MIQGIKLIVYPVRDLDKAKALYSKLLGTEPYAVSPYYVGFKVGDQEIGLDPNGHKKGQTGPICYWQVADLKATVKQYLDSGATLEQEAKDVGGGKLIASVRDADGNVLWLAQA